MKEITKQSPKSSVSSEKQRSYQEIVEFLDKNWATKADASLSSIKKLDQELGYLSKKVNAILVTGINGKSLTIHFAAKLLKEEGLVVGSFHAPHVLTYNELLVSNGELISNKAFTEFGNEVLNAAESLDLNISSQDALTMMALMYFAETNVDVALLEVDYKIPLITPQICHPKVVAITRVTSDAGEQTPEDLAHSVKQATALVQPGTHVISADQSKLSLQSMLDEVELKQGLWAMPIRKLAPLPYPFEQLHGRCAALAERLAHIYVNSFVNNNETEIFLGSLLSKKKGQRGRPTLEAKRKSELNPLKTLEQFWSDTNNMLPGRFDVLDKEKPSILLDNADNLDAFKNLLLGIRLMHYQKALKGLTFLIGSNNPELCTTEFYKVLRYFFKKTSGQIFICPAQPLPGTAQAQSWNVEEVTNALKNMKIKVRGFDSFEQAFEAARESVDERHGLVVISGSISLIREYWHLKGLKKL